MMKHLNFYFIDRNQKATNYIPAPKVEEAAAVRKIVSGMTPERLSTHYLPC